MIKITTIKEKIVREGKDGKKFLILITNPNKVYVFDRDIPESEWDTFEENKTYQLELKESEHGMRLIGFSNVIVAEWPPKK